ncbi:hypothetical protein CAOG_00207 [Capsaspora owczarzaki ATCC 30864]|uniref:Uncharacterized protein n=1 Tax=Capsaspora owczarzaki (strain ATCC 30864) TaxID=595528 RepID=A0A0D2WI54_CAPO3|nr:hypothetical protein CAOG_00207 [Capsaspora owczarzaki ATCC 30864]KJE88568.1 hypothetical protein CAOG_000207 [Capsaspora owczarzaki ATCC 30864]KJE88569.1 hypothetical protein, variant [Capsaspora owczarzaki ATCC 30864]|eukprot:XP_004365078.1 hypothetical protein CAOG_00207 [Capsaspora owczarzaki ATCC 30864]
MPAQLTPTLHAPEADNQGAAPFEAASLFAHARNNAIRVIRQHLTAEEKSAINTGHVYIYCGKKIERWTDNRLWSKAYSTKAGWLIYREFEFDPNNTNGRTKKRKAGGLIKKILSDPTPNSTLRLVFYTNHISAAEAEEVPTSPQIARRHSSSVIPSVAASMGGSYRQRRSSDSLSESDLETLHERDEQNHTNLFASSTLRPSRSEPTQADASDYQDYASIMAQLKSYQQRVGMLDRPAMFYDPAPVASTTFFQPMLGQFADARMTLATAANDMTFEQFLAQDYSSSSSASTLLSTSASMPAIDASTLTDSSTATCLTPFGNFFQPIPSVSTAEMVAFENNFPFGFSSLSSHNISGVSHQ